MGERGISILRFLILARILTPTDFGLLAIATVAIEVLLGLTNVGMIPALIQRPSVEVRHYHAAWTVRIIRASTISAVLVLTAPLVAEAFAAPEATGLLRLIALQPLLDAFGSIRIADLERALKFRPLAMMGLSAALLHTVVAVGLAPVIGVPGVVWGLLAGQALGVAISYGIAPYRPRFTIDRAAAGDLLTFGRWILVTGLVTVIGEAVLRVVISRQLGAAELGTYYIAARLVGFPNGVVSLILGAVTFPLHAQLQSQPLRAVRAFRATLTASLAVLAPVYALLMLLTAGLVTHVVGSEWSAAVPIIRLLAFVALMGIITDAVIPMLEGRGQPQKVTWLILARTVLLLGLTWPLTAEYELAGAALAVFGADVVVQIVAARFAVVMLPKPFHGQLLPSAAIVVASALGAIVGFVTYEGLPGLAGFILAVGAALSVSGWVLRILDRRLGLGLVELATSVFPGLRGLPFRR